MVNKVLAAYMAADGLFVAMGAIMLGFCIIVSRTDHDVPSDGTEAARNLLYQMFPFTAGIANAIMTFVVFLVTLPALVTNSRGWLKLAGYLIVADGLFSLIIGIDLWIMTLRLKETLAGTWAAQTPATQSLMQTTFNCCGFLNSTSPAFAEDATCPSPASAALLQGCAASVNSFGNTFVDEIFTAVFAMVGIDGLLIMATAALLKERKEMERYRHIDEKTGAGGF
ncbi:hypothetical protein GGR56DRAFT_442485 [Xylariaceae sp. FL0804]|nr:hypothetical protein GGR56DRAFT_442485 [Xylariaceae sp. FL0804]